MRYRGIWVTKQSASPVLNWKPYSWGSKKADAIAKATYLAEHSSYEGVRKRQSELLLKIPETPEQYFMGPIYDSARFRELPTVALHEAAVRGRHYYDVGDWHEAWLAEATPNDLEIHELIVLDWHRSHLLRRLLDGPGHFGAIAVTLSNYYWTRDWEGLVAVVVDILIDGLDGGWLSLDALALRMAFRKESEDHPNLKRVCANLEDVARASDRHALHVAHFWQRYLCALTDRPRTIFAVLEMLEGLTLELGLQLWPETLEALSSYKGSTKAAKAARRLRKAGAEASKPRAQQAYFEAWQLHLELNTPG